MLDVQAFRDRWPEFNGAGSVLVQAALDDAANLVSVGFYGKVIDRAHGLQAAHLLCCSPWGTGARLSPKGTDGETTYSKALKRIVYFKGGLRGNT